MNRRQFLAAFPALSYLPLLARALSPWDGEILRVHLPRREYTPEFARTLVSALSTVNAAEFHGEPPGTVRLSCVDCKQIDSLGRRDITLTFRRWTNSTIAGVPVYKSSDFRKLS